MYINMPFPCLVDTLKAECKKPLFCFQFFFLSGIWTRMTESLWVLRYRTWPVRVHHCKATESLLESIIISLYTLMEFEDRFEEETPIHVGQYMTNLLPLTVWSYKVNKNSVSLERTLLLTQFCFEWPNVLSHLYALVYLHLCNDKIYPAIFVNSNLSVREIYI